jgi:hypothetical protein
LPQMKFNPSRRKPHLPRMKRQTAHCRRTALRRKRSLSQRLIPSGSAKHIIPPGYCSHRPRAVV